MITNKLKDRLIILSCLFLAAGCYSLEPVSYALTEEDSDSASISFKDGNPGISFIYYNDYWLPEPEMGTFWDPILFPAGIPLEIMVHAYYYHRPVIINRAGFLVAFFTSLVSANVAASRSVDIDILFTCPPLESGKNYSLSFRKEAGTPGNNRLILTDIESNKIIYRQTFEMR